MAIDRFSFGVQRVPIGTKREREAPGRKKNRARGQRVARERERQGAGKEREKGPGRKRGGRKRGENDEGKVKILPRGPQAELSTLSPPNSPPFLRPPSPTHRHPPCRFSFVLSPPGEFPRLICRFIRQSRSPSWILSLRHFAASASCGVAADSCN